MKLLDWMHRKFRQNAGDPLRDFPIGHPCNCLSSGRTSMDTDHHHYSKHMVTNLRAVSDKWLFSDDLAGDPDEDHDSPPELFDGLLAIGTLGRVEGDVTPTFSVVPPPPPLPPLISVEAIFEKEEESDPSEMDLMVINSELEKVLLIPEVEKGGDRLSSARASHVSAKHCPLQEYLLGSAVLEVVETVEGKEKRQDLHVQSRRHTSLGELFMKTKSEEEEGGPGGGGGGGKKGVQMMVKKMLKKKGGDGWCDGTKVEAHHGLGSDKKFHKIMHMFHKKVHPEPPSAAKKTKAGKPVGRAGEGGRGSADSTGNPVSDSMRALRKDGMLCLRSHSSASDSSSDVRSAGAIGDSNGNREHWIKTDAEYLVLEL